MSPIRFSPSSLKEGRWYEYLIRFALGGGQLSSPASSAAAMEQPSAGSSWPFPPFSAPAPR
jgi:hypothetical protein